MKAWKVFSRLEHTSGGDRKGGVRAHVNYLTREKECSFAISNGRVLDPDRRDEFISAVKGTWDRILGEEKRYDARLDSRLFIPVPNGSDAEALARKVAGIFEKEGVHHLVAIDAGENGKSGVVNTHLQGQFSARGPGGGKKNRAVIDKAFLQRINSTVSAELQRQGYEITTGVPGNHRVPRIEYQRKQREIEAEARAVFDFVKKDYLDACKRRGRAFDPLQFLGYLERLGIETAVVEGVVSAVIAGISFTIQAAEKPHKKTAISAEFQAAFGAEPHSNRPSQGMQPAKPYPEPLREGEAAFARGFQACPSPATV